MSEKLSLYFIIAAIAAISIFFFHVVKPFLIAVFLGTVLAVLFRPLYTWLRRIFWDHKQTAAAVTTLLVLLLILLPVGIALVMAGNQLMQAGQEVVAFLEPQQQSGVEEKFKELEQSKLATRLRTYYTRLPEVQRQQAQQLGAKISEGIASEVYTRTSGLLADVFEFLVTFAIMALAFYYFLTDGEKFLGEVERLLPLNYHEEALLEERFQLVCRGVVLGTIVSGMAQAILAGIGFAVLGVGQVWLLGMLTMFASFIPFLGAATVWGIVAIALLLDNRIGAAIALLLYGSLVISTADNLIRAYVIGNRAHLHPLVALITVLGALRLIGLWGIFVGPMLAALLYAMLDVLRERVSDVERDGRGTGERRPRGNDGAEIVTDTELV